MFRLLILLLAALPAMCAVRLWLKDGTSQSVREYQVEGDRVRFYSVERSDWEEIPLDLIDLNRTRSEEQARETERKADAEAVRVEREAERAMRREIANVPDEPGPYWLHDGAMKALKQAESKMVSNKRRSVLKAITPVPLIAGKATLEIDGEGSAFAVTDARPEFYFRLSKDERFSIVRLTSQKGTRIVERWSIVPVTKEVVQERDEVEIFRQQVGEGLYKIWPQKPIAAGEYAVIQYTEGKVNTQIWDFAMRGGSR